MGDFHEPLRFVHLTDTHIMAGGLWRPRSEDFEFDTEASLRRVVAAIAALEPAPAFAVLGGDLASPDILVRDRVLGADEYEPSYRLLGEILAGLPCPAHFSMGNHDNRDGFARVFGGGANGSPGAACRDSFESHGRRFVILDSLDPGHVDGQLGAGQLAWLDGELSAHPDQPTIVFVHHHPWQLGVRWLDALGLRDGEDLMTRLDAHPQVAAVICGHVHLDQVVQRGRLTLLTSPSTCVQFSKVSQTVKMLPGPPGFRIVDLVGDRLSTKIIQV